MCNPHPPLSLSRRTPHRLARPSVDRFLEQLKPNLAEIRLIVFANRTFRGVLPECVLPLSSRVVEAEFLRRFRGVGLEWVFHRRLPIRSRSRAKPISVVIRMKSASVGIGWPLRGSRDAILRAVGDLGTQCAPKLGSSVRTQI